MNRTNISSNIMNRMAVFESTDCIAATAAARAEAAAAAAAAEITATTNSIPTTAGSTNSCSDRLEQTVDLNGRTIVTATTTTATTMMMSSPPPGVQTDADGLILPKKIINPCLESTDRKQLHRELKFNNKIGKSVLNQKSELQRAYEKQREKQQQQQQMHINEQLSPTANLKGELSRVIMERAQKHEQQQQQHQNDDDEKQYVNPEYLNVRAKLRTGQRADLK